MNLGAVASQLASQPAQALPKDAEGACRALEAQFTTLLFRTMREAMVPASRASSGFARETTQSLLEGQWAELSSRGEGIGLWRTLLQQVEPAAAAVKPGAPRAEEKAMKALRPADFLGARGNGQAAALSPAARGASPAADEDTP